MPRKRAKSKQHGEKLTNSQFWDLVLSKSLSINEKRSPFKSALTRRAAWYEHRDKILNGWLESHPGTRPGAWWSYEAKEQPAEKEEQWEVLHRLGVMDDTEKATVLAMWAKMLHLKEGFNRGAYEHTKRGIGPFHGNPTWEEICSTYDRQTALLGPLATTEWHGIRDNILTEWEERGCGGCDYSLTGGYCKQVACKHWRTDNGSGFS